MSDRFEFNEQNVINVVSRAQSQFCTSYDILVPNCYTQHDNEADLFAIRKSGLCDEFEIKISRADFFNDAKKKINYRSARYFICVDGKVQPGPDKEWYDKHGHLTHNQLNKLVAPWQKLKYDALQDGDMTANYFWYVIKKGEVEVNEIPDFAGVIFVDNDGDFQQVRQPRRLHSKKISDEDKFKCIRKLAYRYWDYRLGRR